jgi:heat shock protein HslJ
MTDQMLTDLLETAGDRHEVGPPPVEEMLRGVRRRRRGRAVLGGAALTLATVATAILVPALARPDHHSAPPEPVTSHPTHPPVVSPPRQSIDLEGTWVVSALVGRNGTSALPAHGRNKVRMTFQDGYLTGTDGCNDISGHYVLRGDRFRVGRDLATTLVGCLPDGAPPLFSRLLDVRQVSRDIGGTYLEDAQGRVVVALTRP